MHLILRWIINALALLAVAYLVPGIEVSGIYIALIVALVLGFINAVIRPVLFVLTLPITIITLGLFSLVLNAFLFWLAASFIDGFEVQGAFAAFIGPIVLSIFSWIGNKFIKDFSKDNDE